MERVYTENDLMSALADIEARAKFLCEGCSESIQDHVETKMVMAFLNRLDNTELTKSGFSSAKSYVMNNEMFLERIITQLPPDMIQPSKLSDLSVVKTSETSWLNGESYDALDELSTAIISETIEDVLSTLTPREEKVLRLRYGFEDGTCHTLNDVGKEFNVSCERIRQIEAKALRKLRHPSRSKKLKDFYLEHGNRGYYAEDTRNPFFGRDTFEYGRKLVEPSEEKDEWKKYPFIASDLDEIYNQNPSEVFISRLNELSRTDLVIETILDCDQEYFIKWFHDHFMKKFYNNGEKLKFGVILCYFWHGMSIEHTAGFLGFDVSRVEREIEEAIKNLRDSSTRIDLRTGFKRPDLKKWPLEKKLPLNVTDPRLPPLTADVIGHVRNKREFDERAKEFINKLKSDNIGIRTIDDMVRYVKTNMDEIGYDHETVLQFSRYLEKIGVCTQP